MSVIVPTLRGGVLIILTAGAFFAAAVHPGTLLFVTVSVFTGALITAFCWGLFSLAGLEAEREMCVNGSRGGEIYLPLTIRNLMRIRRQTCLIYESFPFSGEPCSVIAVHDLLPLEERSVERYIHADIRGKFNLERFRLVSGDPAGLFKSIKTFNFPSDVTVFPAVEKITSLQRRAENTIHAANGSPLGASGEGREIFGLRDYRRGDPVHLVHWKVSARQRRLTVKEFESQGFRTVTIVLDTDKNFTGNDRYDNNFESLVDLAASIIHYFAEIYSEVSLITVDDRSDSFLHCSGSAWSIAEESDGILSELRCGGKRVELLLEKAAGIVPDDSTLYCLSMSANENMYRYFDAMSARGIDIRWYCAPSECFPAIIPGGNSEERRNTLTGYGMHSPEPFILQHGMFIDGILN